MGWREDRARHLSPVTRDPDGFIRAKGATVTPGRLRGLRRLVHVHRWDGSTGPVDPVTRGPVVAPGRCITIERCRCGAEKEETSWVSM
jgi:hypothetical protein